MKVCPGSQAFYNGPVRAESGLSKITAAGGPVANGRQAHFAHADKRPVHFIETQDQLKEAIQLLKGHQALAVDTESNSLYAFQERVCVLQMATPADLFIVDPITCPDLELLAPFFADAKVVKIFHGADYDIMCLKRDFNFEIRNVFDSYVASRMVGHHKLGLADMVNQYVGVTLQKKYTKSDWGQRPLSDEQVDYLLDDVRYLHVVLDNLSREMSEKGKAKEESILQAFRKLEDLPPMRSEPQVDDFWRMKNIRDLSPVSLGALKALVELRIERARKLDRPVFKVIGNDTMVAIARSLPATPAELSQIRGVGPRLQRAMGGQILRAVRQGAKSPVKRPPRQHKPHRRGVQKLDDPTLNMEDAPDVT